MEEIQGTGTICLAAASILICAIGVFIHSFVAIVNITDWLKGAVLSSTDHILTVLGVTRIFFQCSATCYIVLIFFFPRALFKEFLLFAIDLSEVFFTYLSFWLTTLLSVVFCLKICNLKSGLFLFLKSLILPKVLHFIVMSVLVSICYTTVCIWFGNFELPQELEIAKTNNGTLEANWNYVVIFVFGTFAPSFIYLVAAVLLVVSVCLHMSRMRGHSHSMTHFKTFHTAIQFVTVCSLYYIVHASGIQVAFYCYYFQSMEYLWLYTITDSLPVLHSIYLICKTAKLRSRFSVIVHCATNWEFGTF
ncbi:putative taste receptor type 2 member 33 [Dendropsophus ebraccatus]|uniref:putative taste receptor type 2 member 33 n=1 Tax=Dendropsophus ebraccatus TaxID=150705 RepID=UPI0038322222